jgi:hypothetical protein
MMNCWLNWWIDWSLWLLFCSFVRCTLDCIFSLTNLGHESLSINVFSLFLILLMVSFPGLFRLHAATSQRVRLGNRRVRPAHADFASAFYTITESVQLCFLVISLTLVSRAAHSWTARTLRSSPTRRARCDSRSAAGRSHLKPSIARLVRLCEAVPLGERVLLPGQQPDAVILGCKK